MTLFSLRLRMWLHVDLHLHISARKSHVDQSRSKTTASGPSHSALDTEPHWTLAHRPDPAASLIHHLRGSGGGWRASQSPHHRRSLHAWSLAPRSCTQKVSPCDSPTLAWGSTVSCSKIHIGHQHQQPLLFRCRRVAYLQKSAAFSAASEVNLMQ